MYGIYDGHGGSCERLYKLLAAEMDIEDRNTMKMYWENIVVDSL